MIIPNLGTGPSKNHTHTPPHPHPPHNFAVDVYTVGVGGGGNGVGGGGNGGGGGGNGGGGGGNGGAGNGVGDGDGGLDDANSVEFYTYDELVSGGGNGNGDGGGLFDVEFGPYSNSPSPPKPHHNGSHPHKPPHHNTGGDPIPFLNKFLFILSCIIFALSLTFPKKPLVAPSRSAATEKLGMAASFKPLMYVPKPAAHVDV